MIRLNRCQKWPKAVWSFSLLILFPLALIYVVICLLDVFWYNSSIMGPQIHLIVPVKWFVSSQLRCSSFCFSEHFRQLDPLMPGPTQWQCILKVNVLAVEKDQGTPRYLLSLLRCCVSYKCVALWQKLHILHSFWQTAKDMNYSMYTVFYFFKLQSSMFITGAYNPQLSTHYLWVLLNALLLKLDK